MNDTPHHHSSTATLREVLAALAHEQWSGWMRHLFSKCSSRIVLRPLSAEEFSTPADVVIPHAWAERWERQMDTPYASLSETEKESDRKEADRVLAVLETQLKRNK